MIDRERAAVGYFSAPPRPPVRAGLSEGLAEKAVASMRAIVLQEYKRAPPEGCRPRLGTSWADYGSKRVAAPPKKAAKCTPTGLCALRLRLVRLSLRLREEPHQRGRAAASGARQCLAGKLRHHHPTAGPRRQSCGPESQFRRAGEAAQAP